MVQLSGTDYFTLLLHIFVPRLHKVVDPIYSFPPHFLDEWGKEMRSAICKLTCAALLSRNYRCFRRSGLRYHQVQGYSPKQQSLGELIAQNVTRYILESDGGGDGGLSAYAST
jgi:hypothetical protein